MYIYICMYVCIYIYVCIYTCTCTQMFYHLYHARAAAGIKTTTFVRLEQIAPFPYDIVARAIHRYPNAELVWVQEEPRNMGAWAYVKPRFDTTLREKLLDHAPIRYVCVCVRVCV